VLLEGLGKLKKCTSSGIDPMAFRLRYRVPHCLDKLSQIWEDLGNLRNICRLWDTGLMILKGKEFVLNWRKYSHSRFTLSRDSSLGIAMTAGVRFSAGARDCSLLHSFHTSSGARPTSFPVGNWPGREAGHSPQSNAEVKVLDLYLISLNTSSWRLA
jgi:hypothetical protein